jgi:hypothetical protein
LLVVFDLLAEEGVRGDEIADHCDRLDNVLGGTEGLLGGGVIVLGGTGVQEFLV